MAELGMADFDGIQVYYLEKWLDLVRFGGISWGEVELLGLWWL
jgi:hypothetical protein